MYNSYTVVISVGRNVKDTPMPREEWDAFRLYLRESCDYAGTVVQAPNLMAYESTQVGYWEGEREEAATYIVLTTYPKMCDLRHRCALAAAQWKQEAIGFIVAKGWENFVP